VGPDSAVGITTYSGVEGPTIESRWVRYFRHPSRPNLGNHTVSCAVVTDSLSQGKTAGACSLPPTTSSVGFKKEYSYNITTPVSLHDLSWCENYPSVLCPLLILRINGSMLNVTCITVRIDRYCLMYKYIFLVWSETRWRFVTTSFQL
jgi:hypothetical protein